jgi:hypothetical protein
MPGLHCYAAHTVASDLPLPELPAAESSRNPDFRVTLSDQAVLPATSLSDWQHGFEDPQGDVAFRCSRHGGDFYFDFPGIAQARLTTGGDIHVWQCPSGSGASTRHVLLDQVLPRAIAQRGHLVLHGSAVRTARQQVLVILGDSGMGKSTLASAFACSGADVLSDDGVLLDFSASRIRAVPGYPGLRLWPDSLGALFAQRAGESTPMSHYNDKRRLSQPRAVAGALDVDAVVLLQAPRDERVAVEPLSPQAACLAMTRNSFQLDLGDHANLERLFAQAAQASRTLPVLALTYPRDYAVLPAVIDHVTRAVLADRSVA